MFKSEREHGLSLGGAGGGWAPTLLLSGHVGPKESKGQWPCMRRGMWEKPSVIF